MQPVTSQRPLLHPAASPRGRNIVAVASGKGGVGKTWLSITLAHAMAQAGQRVLLFDGDVGLANIDIQLGLMPQKDLGSVVAGRIKLADAVTRYETGGFDIIAGKSGSGSLGTLDSSRLGHLRDDLLMLAGMYDRVVIDLGAGVDQTVRTLAATGGAVLVVATDEPTSMTDAYAFIKLNVATGTGADQRIVINMAGSTKEGEKTYAKLRKVCETFLKFSPPLAGIIRRDDKVRESIRNQTPLLIRAPGAPAAADVQALVDLLMKDGRAEIT